MQKPSLDNIIEDQKTLKNKVPYNLYGIHMDTVIHIPARECFIEFLETLPHIKKYAKDNRSVWYVFEYSSHLRYIIDNFLQNYIGVVIHRYPWVTNFLVSVYYNDLITLLSCSGPECIYVPNTASDKIKLSVQEIFSIIN